MSRMTVNATTKHLWEIDHSYYCSLESYFSNETYTHFESFDEFLEMWGDADPDYNLLFRWDWRTGYEYRTGHVLEIFWIAQRKGYFMSTSIDVTPDDEQRVIKFLKPKKDHLFDLWEGIP